jgi:hypothetical protein
MVSYTPKVLKKNILRSTTQAKFFQKDWGNNQRFIYLNFLTELILNILYRISDVRSSSTVEPYVTSFDHPEYSAFRTSDRQCGEQSLPIKERKKHQLERWQDKSQVRHSYNIPDSVFCLPHHEAGLMYIRWLTLRNISVQHLV